ncbi:hypothetical protein [Sporosarcina luteola]|nr:hypothetical protein [Sporosarcina luteola]
MWNWIGGRIETGDAENIQYNHTRDELKKCEKRIEPVPLDEESVL